MTEEARMKWLRVALKVNGVIALTFVPAAVLIMTDSPLVGEGTSPAAFIRWHPFNPAYEMMVIVILLVLSLFLWRAAADPPQHRSLIECGAWVFLAHGGIMLLFAFLDSSERAHTLGDILINGLVGGVLLWLRPHPASTPVQTESQTVVSG